ncbi:class I SAM-dependent methyltransferase [uncultured Enterovirga sp.]|uniref:class I SAM-dependent methyltransferase n=1 Tax=uncultured Enterovirga sp. TaxID=2026352 RepID=UPI0035CC7EB2
MTLSTLFFEHVGHQSDKWEQYLGIYEAELGCYVDEGRPIRLLEIGVSNGGSLEIWRKFLPEGSEIVGIDINPECGKLTVSEGIEVFVGDASDKATLDALLGDRSFDVIVDDGSHRSDHIISTFEALFPRLRGGGKYVVEDLHASYWEDWGGGFRKPGAAIEYFKDLVDGLNADSFLETPDLPVLERARLEGFGRAATRVTFYDSVLVIELLGTPRSAPYRQMFAGETAKVTDPVLLLIHAPLARTQTILVGQSAARHIDRVLLAEIDRLRAAKQAVVELDQMKRSTSWRVTAPLRALKQWFGRPA